MSFKCDYCGKAQPAGSKPVLQTPEDSWRPMVYEYFDPETEEIKRVSGREMVAEFKTCRDCLELGPEVKAPEPELRTFLLQTQGYHDHARGCKGTKTVRRGEDKEQIPCRVCELIARDFAAFPLQTLSRCLEDPMTRGLKTPIYLLVRDKMIDKSTDDNAFLSKRGLNDGSLAIGLLKHFSSNNPKLLRG